MVAEIVMTLQNEKAGILCLFAGSTIFVLTVLPLLSSVSPTMNNRIVSKCTFHDNFQKAW